jgi:hypothetical protein
VLVEVHRRGDVLVAQAHREILDIHPAPARECRVSVAKIVEPDLLEPQPRHTPTEALGLVLGVEQRPLQVWEDEVEIHVVPPKCESLLELATAMVTKNAPAHSLVPYSSAHPASHLYRDTAGPIRIDQPSDLPRRCRSRDRPPDARQVGRPLITEGEQSLEDRSSRPECSPNQTASDIEDRVEALRRSRRLGPVQLVGLLAEEGITLPASTVYGILVRRGITRPRDLDLSGEDLREPAKPRASITHARLSSRRNRTNGPEETEGSFRHVAEEFSGSNSVVVA